MHAHTMEYNCLAIKFLCMTGFNSYANNDTTVMITNVNKYTVSSSALLYSPAAMLHYHGDIIVAKLLTNMNLNPSVFYQICECLKESPNVL